MKKNLFLTLIIAFLFCTFILSLASSYSKTMFKNISNNFLRLHIIANSDSTEDQMIKYEIRDSILEYLSPYLEKADNKESAIKILNNHIEEINNLAENITKKNNYNQPVKVSIDSSYFPAKSYGNITLPEGFYDSLKIEIGKSTGQNWWCVMYPCLCSIDSSTSDFTYKSDELLCQELGNEEISLITESNNSKLFKFKFKLLELFENL